MSGNIPRIQDDPTNDPAYAAWLAEQADPSSDPGYAAWAAEMEKEFNNLLQLEAFLGKQIGDDYTQIAQLLAEVKKDGEDLAKHITIDKNGKIHIDAQGLADLKDEFACIGKISKLNQEIDKDKALLKQLEATKFENGGIIDLTGDDSQTAGSQNPVPTNDLHQENLLALNQLSNAFYSFLMNKEQTVVAQKPATAAATAAEAPVTTGQTGTVDNDTAVSTQKNGTTETAVRAGAPSEKTSSKEEVQNPSALPLGSYERVSNNIPSSAARSTHPQSNELFEKLFENLKSPATQKFAVETVRKFNQLLSSFAQNPEKVDQKTPLPTEQKATSEPKAKAARPLNQKNGPALTVEETVQLKETVQVKTNSSPARLVEETPKKADAPALKLDPKAPRTTDFTEETLQAVRTIGTESAQRLTLQILTESKQPATPELKIAVKTASETAVRTAISVAVAILDTGTAPSKEERNDLAVDTAQKTAEAVEAHGSTLAAILTTPRLGNSTPSSALPRSAQAAAPAPVAAKNGEVDNLVVPFTANITFDARTGREIPQFAAAAGVLKVAVDQFGPEASLNFFTQELSLNTSNSSQELLKQALVLNLLQMVGPTLNPQTANPMQQINNDNGKVVLFSAIVDKVMQSGRNHTGRDLGEEQVESENNHTLGLSLYNQERVHAQMLAHEVV